MYRRSEIPTIQRGAMSSLQAALYGVIGLAAVLDGAILKLFQNQAAVTPDNVVADFTEADFGGYAQVTPLAWNGPANQASQGLYGFAQGVFAADNTIVDPQEIFGYYVTNAAEDTVLVAESFGSTVNFALDGDTLDLDFYLQLNFSNTVTVS